MKKSDLQFSESSLADLSRNGIKVLDREHSTFK